MTSRLGTGKSATIFYSVYSPADQRIFPNHLMFVDLDQLVPDLLQEKDLYILLLISEYFLIT